MGSFLRDRWVADGGLALLPPIRPYPMLPGLRDFDVLRLVPLPDWGMPPKAQRYLLWMLHTKAPAGRKRGPATLPIKPVEINPRVMRFAGCSKCL